MNTFFAAILASLCFIAFPKYTHANDLVGSWHTDNYKYIIQFNQDGSLATLDRAFDKNAKSRAGTFKKITEGVYKIEQIASIYWEVDPIYNNGKIVQLNIREPNGFEFSLKTCHADSNCIAL